MTAKIGPLDSAEVKFVRFRFADELPAGNTILSATVEVALTAGTDATPSALVSGAATVSGSDVLQKVIGRNIAASYHLRCIATDDSGQVHVVSCDLNQRQI